MALGLAGTAMVVTPSSTAGAATATLVVDYACSGGIAGTGPGTVNLRTRLTVPTTLNVGDPLNVEWKLNYTDGTLGSPAYMPNGGRIDVIGRANISGSWVGQLQPTGTAEQPGPIDKGVPLKLPVGISDFGHTDRAGTVTVRPGKTLFVDFRPSASEVMVNDDDPAITYNGGWEDHDGLPSEDHDHHLDLHSTTVKDAWASYTFTGTGIEYVAQKDRDAGPIDIAIDGQPAAPPRVDPSRNADGTLVNDAHRGGQTLWKFHGLKYEQHTITIKNVQDAKLGQLDAFRVITRDLVNAPKDYRAECTLVNAPGAIQVEIGGGGDNPASPSPDTSASPSASPSASASPTDENPGGDGDGDSPPPSPSPSATPSPSPSASPSPAAAQTQNYIVTAVVTQGSPSPTATRTVTLTATPSVAQVAITPQGGAQTGEAPERMSSSGMLLIGSGGALLMIGMLSGVAMLRRRAAHSGERG
ncbi:hypothetical protein [Microbispora bryophytorum]|uniref:hypothetical protein n=1 Tax=Microbispora bryophytorum TaxID=1460882 RepID=UPI0033C0A760